jgi:hypothetical protein
MSSLPGSTISAILRHDNKVTSYKFALLRAINDVVLAFPDLASGEQAVAIPLRMLADRWIAYYWPFVGPQTAILQGPVSQQDGQTRQDMSLRSELSRLYSAWEQFIGSAAQPSDGYLLVADLRVERLRNHYPATVLDAYTAARRAIITALQKPIRHAGPRGQEWSVFPRPALASSLGPQIICVPGTRPADRCLLVEATLWTMFRDLSLWVEALCVHEWSLFTERVTEDSDRPVDRGKAYWLLTAHPESRRPLTWERNHIEILLLEGETFTCPWTGRRIVQGTPFDIDHLLPLAIYPMNDLWNLVPADPTFNQHTKRDLIPSLERLHIAEPHLAQTYALYISTPLLRKALVSDTEQRFRSLLPADTSFPQHIARAAIRLIDSVAIYRNLARF